MENENNTYEIQEINVTAKGLTGYVIKWHLAKDENVAEKRMVIVSIVFFLLSIYFFAKAAGLI